MKKNISFTIDKAPKRGYNIIKITKRPQTGLDKLEELKMTATLTKIEKTWTLIINRDDGTTNDYRFSSKKEAFKWARQAGIEI